jgi:hypothetical protein
MSFGKVKNANRLPDGCVLLRLAHVTLELGVLKKLAQVNVVRVELSQENLVLVLGGDLAAAPSRALSLKLGCLKAQIYGVVQMFCFYRACNLHSQ